MSINNPYRIKKQAVGFGYRHVYCYFPKYVKEPILNLGCGSGALEVFLEKFGVKDITSVDYFNILLKGYKKTRFIKHNLEKFPYPIKKKFNTIALLATISILESPYKALREINRLLNPGGTLLISFAKHKKHFRNTGVKYIFSPASARFMLEENGFKIIRQFNDCYFGLKFLQPLWNIFPSHYTWFICRKVK